MRDLPPMNAYQQLIHCALALVHEEDLVAIFRALRRHPERNRCVDLLNQALDDGYTLWAAFDAPSPLFELFQDDMPELRLRVTGNRIAMDFGTFGPPSDILDWEIHMSGTGQVESIQCMGRYCPENGNKGIAPPWFSLS